MEEQKHAHKNNNQPKRRFWKWLLIITGSLLALLIIAVLILGGTLFSRLAKPGSTVFEEEEAVMTPLPTAVPTPEPTPEPTPAEPLPEGMETPIPTPTPVPTPEPPLPLSEHFEQTRLTPEQLQLMEQQNKNTHQYINVLLIGVDRRGRSGNSQADTMMIATIDKKNGRLKLTSILRDMLVEIPGYGQYRINSAAAKGGIPLLMETLNTNFDLNLTKYVLVDFSMFEKVVDKMGGVTIRMSAAEISAANDCIAGLNKQRGVEYLWDGFIFAEPGNVKCTGKQALGYARIRKIDSDFSRTNRQFKVLTAIFAKFKSRGLAKQYEIIHDLLPNVETNMGIVNIVDRAIAAVTMNTEGILHSTVPQEGLYKNKKVNGSSVLVADLPAHAWLIHEFIYTNTDTPDEAKVLSPGASLPPRTPSPTLDPALFPDGVIPEGWLPNSAVSSTLTTPTPEPEPTPELDIPELTPEELSAPQLAPAV